MQHDGKHILLRFCNFIAHAAYRTRFQRELQGRAERWSSCRSHVPRVDELSVSLIDANDVHGFQFHNS